MSVQQNKDMAVKFLNEFEHRDAAKIAAIISDDFEYKLMTRMQGAEPMARKAVLENFLPMLKTAVPEGFNFKIHTVMGEGDHVAVQAESDTKTAAGKKYANRYHFYFRFKGGKIAEVQEYCDTNHVREVFFS